MRSVDRYTENNGRSLTGRTNGHSPQPCVAPLRANRSTRALTKSLTSSPPLDLELNANTHSELIPPAQSPAYVAVLPASSAQKTSRRRVRWVSAEDGGKRGEDVEEGRPGEKGGGSLFATVPVRTVTSRRRGVDSSLPKFIHEGWTVRSSRAVIGYYAMKTGILYPPHEVETQNLRVHLSDVDPFSDVENFLQVPDAEYPVVRTGGENRDSSRGMPVTFGKQTGVERGEVSTRAIASRVRSLRKKRAFSPSDGGGCGAAPDLKDDEACSYAVRGFVEPYGQGLVASMSSGRSKTDRACDLQDRDTATQAANKGCWVVTDIVENHRHELWNRKAHKHFDLIDWVQDGGGGVQRWTEISADSGRTNGFFPASTTCEGMVASLNTIGCFSSRPL
ncbi:hypothetical protein BXZ70DRAFT_908044 [Cristinia sonorae]|uniref:Uncharacterized protein n=1 Tax=Cristinia sonorae TaxID=1940300 RepID=A0A8K0ULS3_9AGAR|nr:hypothetical protein BXZ70DRAFT_908044 [Cristinia sonorae]